MKRIPRYPALVAAFLVFGVLAVMFGCNAPPGRPQILLPGFLQIPPPPQKLTTSVTALSVNVGATNSFTATDVGSVATITATSGTPSVSTVSPSSGTAPGPITFTMTGVAPGTSTVNVTDGVTTVPVTVTVPTPVLTTSVSTLSVNLGATGTFTASETNCTCTISASSGNAGVATVSPSSGAAPGPVTFTMTPVTPGTTTVTVSDSRGRSTPVVVTVPTPVLSTSKSALWVVVGVPGTFTASQTNFTGSIAASSSIPATATVAPASGSAPGPVTFTVTGVAFGEANIAVTSGPNTVNVPVVVTTPTPGPPASVQFWTYSTNNGGFSAGETSSTVALPTSAPHQPINPGDTLLACATVSDTATGPTVTAPAGLTLVAGSHVAFSWNTQQWYSQLAGNPQPTSLTFTYNHASIAQIWVWEITGTKGIDVLTSLQTTTAGSGGVWSGGTGTGTATGLYDLGIICGSIDDSILTATPPPSGYGAQSGLGTHNTNGAPDRNGNTAVTFIANALITLASIPSSIISWINGGETEHLIGQQILMLPAATPTPAPNATPSNGPDWTGGFRAYASNSIWNVPLPTNTTFPFASDSAAVTGDIFPSGLPDWGEWFPFISDPGFYDPSFQVYFTKPGDPVVTITGCSSTGWFGANNCVGVGTGFDVGEGVGKIRIPANMHVQGGSNDNVFSVVQLNGTEVVGYCFDSYDNGCNQAPGFSNSSPHSGAWTNGANFPNGGFMASCGNFFTGAGWVGQTNPMGGATQGATVGQGGQCGASGLLHPNELAGTPPAIQHVLYGLVWCDSQHPAVYPAAGDAGAGPPCTSTSGLFPIVGERWWYDIPCNNTSPGHVGFAGTFTMSNASLTTPFKNLLCAANQYGVLILDNIGDSGAQETGLTFRTWGEVSAAFNGSSDPGAPLLSLGWSSSTSIASPGNWYEITSGAFGFPRTVPNSVPAVSPVGHWHVLCESVTQGGSGCH